MLSIKLRQHTILKNVGCPLPVYIKQNYVQNISITIKLSELSPSLISVCVLPYNTLKCWLTLPAYIKQNYVQKISITIKLKL